jgi:hypothetical protein
MKENNSMVRLVFGCIDDVVATTENIHKNIVENVKGSSPSGFEDGGKRKGVYDTIKMVTGKVEETISGLKK